MLGLCRVGASKRMGFFWALICVMNFAGTIQGDTTTDAGKSMTTDPTSSVTSSNKIAMKNPTSTTIHTTDNPTKATTSAASVSPSGTSEAEVTTKEMNATHTLPEEGGTISPVTDKGATANTTILEKNATDTALLSTAMTETYSEHLNTTKQTTPPAATQLATMTVSHLPSDTTPHENVEPRVDPKTTSDPESKPQTTLIALVTTGVVVAALILCAYFLSNRQSWSPGSRRLDNDYDYAVNDSPDNTLISVATRDQPGQPDKPNLKAGNQENGTGQAVTPAATNGHSNKQHIVADTEL